MNDLNVNISKGTYVIAVSGGVDSMVLLDLLSKKPNINLIVAHYDHGIRNESKQDRLLVQQVAQKYKLPFVFDKANLGPGTSEAQAREARYSFLRSVKDASSAKAIITAHHEDDVIETAILNILRGTNRKGLSSLKSVDGIIRPITSISKSSLYNYAKATGLNWNEDSTNKDINYKRNYIRHKIVPKFNNEQRNQFLKIIRRSAVINGLIDNEAAAYLDANLVGNKLNRQAFIILPHSVSKEIMATWLRLNEIRDFDSKLLEILTIGAKTLKPDHRIDINTAYFLEINKDDLALINREC